VECRTNVARHEDADVASCVVPLERESKAAAAGPVDGDLAQLLKGVDQVIGVFLSHALDAEVIDD
jgi:hypothetical protein